MTPGAVNREIFETMFGCGGEALLSNLVLSGLHFWSSAGEPGPPCSLEPIHRNRRS